MTNDAIHCLAPAKLNLFLHITGKRPDGYHDLQTLFQLLDYGDELSFSPNTAGLLSLSAHGPTASAMPLDDNLILRAAKLLRAKCVDESLGADILINKRLPAGAGLGGGSSDAAATLVSLNRLWDLGLSNAQLCELGITLAWRRCPSVCARTQRVGRRRWRKAHRRLAGREALPRCDTQLLGVYR